MVRDRFETCPLKEFSHTHTTPPGTARWALGLGDVLKGKGLAMNRGG